MSSTQSSRTRNVAFTDGLRALVDLIDAHPRASSEHDSYRHLIYVTTREEMMAVVRELGGHWEKGFQAGAIDDHYFDMIRDLGGGVKVMVYAPRANVCERVVVGTETVEVPDPDLVAAVPTKTVEREVVEWRCPPSLLAEPEYSVRIGAPAAGARQ